VVTANRVERASKKRRRLPVALFLIPIVLVAGIAVMLLVLGGEGAGIPILGGGTGPDDSTPEFDFRVGQATVVATDAEAKRGDLVDDATAVADEITPTIDDLFTNAFLDPTNWREGDYEEVFTAFTEQSRPTAEQNLEVLTLGVQAGDVFEDVEPGKGRLVYDVLFDREGNPATAVVTVSFTAIGERTDGTFLQVVSDGQFFFESVDGWKIVSFDVVRKDQDVEAPTPAQSGASGTSGATGASA
jgi:hypothetical protein